MVKVDNKNDVAHFNDIEIPLQRMIGVMGVAPAGEAIGCGRIGDHGENMDNRLITNGTTVYLPVNTPGGLLQIGDLHGAMGDGELSGAGLEISGAATVTVDLIKDFHLDRPLVETADRDTYEETLQLAMADKQRLLWLGRYGH